MRGRRAAAALAVAAALSAACSGPARDAQPSALDASSRPSDAPDERARAAARAFLDQYVEPDGRVVRHDQGGDTVSEGQSYALLLADVVDDGELADRVAAWTREHLRRPDGLFSYLAGADGRVRDEQAASDGDVVIAWALARDGDVPTELVRSVLASEVVRRDDLTLLAAGPWATGEPATLNPSYWVQPAYVALAEETGDPAWQALAGDVREAVLDVTDGGRLLPPDWARADGTTLSSSPAPSGAVAEVRYSLDAQRTVVWLATSCSEQDRALAARWWPVLRRSPAALALSPDGQVLDSGSHPLPLVASAAAADAAGDVGERDRLLDEAAAQDGRRPTYYGSAWVALGRALLQTDLLEECS